MKFRDIVFDFGIYRHIQTRTFNFRKPGKKSLSLGHGWKTNPLVTRMVKTRNGYKLSLASGKGIVFEPDPENERQYHGVKESGDTLIVGESGFEVVRKDKSVWRFEQNMGQSAVLNRIDCPDGRVVLFEYDAENHLVAIKAYRDFVQKLSYGRMEFYYQDDRSILKEIVVMLADQNGTLVKNARVCYDYYGENDQNGNVGDLKTVATFTGSAGQWAVIDTHYYRYYRENDLKGRPHALKFVFLADDFADLQNRHGNALFNATDEDICSLATRYFEYDDIHRVNLEEMYRGTEVKKVSFEKYDGMDDANCVYSRKTESWSDGRSISVYKNRRGRMLLRETIFEADGIASTLRECSVLDDNNNIVKRYSASSVQNAKIVDRKGGKYVEIEAFPDQGEIISFEMLADKPKSKRKSVFIQQGEGGSPILLRKWDFVERKVKDKTVLNVSGVTEYPDDNAEKGINTRYQYDWQEDSRKIKRRSRLLPVVSEEEHGDGAQVSQTEVFDTRGRTVWSMNESGVISHSVYDEIGDKIVRRIDDVDTTKTADFGTPLPEGWTTPDEAGKHDITDFAYDFKGRLVQTTRPESEGIDDNGKLVRCRPVSWTVYDDAARTQCSASGYLELDDDGSVVKTVLVNPVSIMIQDASGNIADQIQASRKNLEGPLTEGDSFDQASYISWTKNIYHFGKLVAVRHYHLIPESGEGVSGDCYAETIFDYDIRGRQVRTVLPSGAIHRTVYDERDNAVQSWIGTNDSGATDTNPKSDDPANDMRMASETVYGQSSQCTSCSGGSGDRILVQVQHLGNGKSRVTEYKYDWRGRQTETLGDEDEKGNSIASVQYYDNLDRVIKTEQYLHQEDKKTKRNEQRLLSRTQIFLNARGQAWKTVQSIIEKKSK